MSLGGYIERKEKGEEPENVVILTVDDGYRDFYSLAYPLLKKYGMPATVFITAGFASGEIWFWWDKLRYVLSRLKKGGARFLYQGRTFSLNGGSREQLNKTWDELSAYCVGLPEEGKKEFVESLAKSVGVHVPADAPEQFGPMSWSQIADVSNNGVEIGSHTKSHPILSGICGRELDEEIKDSKLEIEGKIGKKVRTFAHPNGQPQDYNKNVFDALQRASYDCAVAAHDRISSTNGKYAITRMSIPGDRVEFLWKLYGMSSLVTGIRLAFFSLIGKQENPAADIRSSQKPFHEEYESDEGSSYN